jgi:hypothetical protein
VKEKAASQPLEESALHDALRVLQGTDVTDEELLEYISESSTMSKAMDDYDGAAFALLFHACMHAAALHGARWAARLCCEDTSSI